MLLEVRPGEGGSEAEQFGEELFSALVSYVSAKGFTPRAVKRTQRIFVCEVDGPDGLRSLSGTHRIQRIPRGSAARHTSTATVAVLDPEAAGSS